MLVRGWPIGRKLTLLSATGPLVAPGVRRLRRARAGQDAGPLPFDPTQFGRF